jgi:hypothetical protein
MGAGTGVADARKKAGTVVSAFISADIGNERVNPLPMMASVAKRDLNCIVD